MREESPGGSASPATAAGAAGARFPSRRALVTAAALAVLLIPLILAYEAALARVQHERAAIERVLAAYTGLELEFATLELGWGWGGPEAVFGKVELAEPQRTSVRIHAERLVIGFNSWASLRRGELEISRVALIAPQIDLTTPRAAPALPAAAGAARAGDLADELLAWLARAPLGRIDIEAGTVRLAGTRSSHGPLELELNRATLRRSPERLAASAYVYLPQQLGHSVFVSLSLDGDLRHRRSLRGESRIVGERLVLAPWLEILAPAAPAATGGLLDLHARVRFEQGVVRFARGEITGDGILAGGAGSSARRSSLPYIRADAEFEADGAQSQLRLTNIAFARRASARAAVPAPATLALTWREQSPQLAGDAQGIPAAALLSLAALAPGADAFGPLLALDTGGTIRRLRFALGRLGARPQQWRVDGVVDALALRTPEGGYAADGLEAAFTGSERGLTIDVAAERAGLRTPSAAALEDLEVNGRLQLAPAAGGWVLGSERLRVANAAGEALVSGELDGHSDGSASLALHAEAPNVDLDRLGLGVIPGGRVTGLRAEVHGHIGAGKPQMQLDSSGALAFAGVAVAAARSWPAATDLAGRLSWSADRYRLELARGRTLGLAIDSAVVSGSRLDVPRVDMRAHGPLEGPLAWAREARPLSMPDALAGVDLTGEAAFAFSLRAASRLGRSAPAWRLATTLARAQLRVPGGELVSALSGDTLLVNGTLQPTRLHGQWLGGSLELRVLAPMLAGPAGASTRVRAQGTLDGARLTRLLAGDSLGPVPAFEGRADWRASFLARAEDRRPGAGIEARDARWRMVFDSTLSGLGSHLPAPFGKELPDAVPLHLEMVPQGPQARLLTIALGTRMRARVRLTGEPVAPRLERGVVRFAGDPRGLELPSRPGLIVTGHVARVDLAQLLALAGASPGFAPPLLATADLSVGTLAFAGQRFSDVRVQARHDRQCTALTFTAQDLAGEIDWREAASRAAAGAGDRGGDDAARVALNRVRLAGALDERELARMAGALPAAGATVDVGELDWSGMRLGHVSLVLAPEDGALRLDALHATRPGHELRGSARCVRATQECRLRVELASEDVAATLRDFGFSEGITANRARLSAELLWPLAGGGSAGFERLSGRVALELDAGHVVAGTGGPSLPLLGVTALYGTHASADRAGNAASGPQPDLAPDFERLSASFDVGHGLVSTTDLRVAAADYEILGRGRLDLAARERDEEYVVLRGADRLPEPVQRIGAGPRVAAAWLALREALRPAAAVSAPQAFRVHGGWDSPVLDPVSGPP